MIRVAALSLLSALLAAQGISPDEIRVTSHVYVPKSAHLQVETDVVEIGVVVRDNHGRAVSGLTRENFQVHDNGKPREIADFSLDSTGPAAPPDLSSKPADAEVSDKTAFASKPAAPRPRFIALYFDDVNAKDAQHSNDLKQTQDAAEKFVEQVLRPGVQVGVFTASGAQTLDFTTDLAKVSRIIGSVRPHVRLSETSCPNPYLAYLVVVRHDSTAAGEMAFKCKSRASDAEMTWQRARQLSKDTLESIGQVADHLATMAGTRVLLLASSGFLTATLEPQRDRIINRALQSGIVINALDSKGLYDWLEPVTKNVPLAGPPGLVAAGLAHNRFETAHLGLRVEAMNEPLAALAEGTGGVFYHNNNDLQAGFEELAAPPEVTYRLSFPLHDVAADGNYHKLKVTVLHAPYKSVQARPGYFAPTEKPAETSKFDSEVLAKDTVEDFPVDLGTQNTRLPDGDMTVSIIAKVDVSKLAFSKQGDRRTQRVRFVSALIDSQGAVVAAKEATMDLALKADTYSRLAKTGLNAKLTLEVAPGAYQLREVVEEAGGQLACSTHPIEIR